jgi:pimeloyl-ACP methyl ester carboxylesterase
VVARYPQRDWILVDLYSGARTLRADVSAFDRLATAVTDLIGELARGPIVLAGNSTGGMLAQTIAITGQVELEALVLVGTGASAEGVREPFRAALRDWLQADGVPPAQQTRDLVRALVADVPDPAAFDRYVEAVVSADYRFLRAVLTGLLARDVTDQLGSIRAPTLVVRGVEDNARTAEHVRILCAGIPDSTSIEIRNSGHSPMVDQPAAFEAAVRQFLHD